jgi:hypothetical protein
VVRSQPGEIVHETVFQKNPSQKTAGGVALSSKPRTTKEKSLRPGSGSPLLWGIVGPPATLGSHPTLVGPQATVLLRS